MKFKAFFPLFILLLLTGSPSAQIQEEIKGRILPAKGENMLPESVMVTLRSMRGGFRETHPLHTSGNFSFVNVPPGGGDYFLEVSSPNRETVTRQFQLLAGITSGIAPFITLQLGALLGADDVPAESGQTLSARWLSLPEAVREQLTAADRASDKGDHHAAIKHLERALEIEPTLYHAYNNLAVEHLALGDQDAAVEALTKSIELEPDVASTHRNLGVIHLDSDRSAEALKHFRKARQLDPEDFETSMLLGETYYLQNQLALATQSFAKAVEVDAASAEAHLNLGQCYFRQDRAAEAVAEFRLFLDNGGESDARAPQVRALIERLEGREDSG